MKYLIVTIAMFLLSQDCLAQAGGMRAYAGITTMTNRDPVAAPNDAYHSGYHIGADGRLMSGTMSFIVGARYTSVAMLPTNEFSLNGSDSRMSIMNGRVGLDLTLLTVTNWLRIRTKALGSFDLVLGSDSDVNVAPGYNLNGGWLGGVTGLGFDMGPATLDIEFEFGVLNAYNQKKRSHFNSMSISAGVFF